MGFKNYRGGLLAGAGFERASSEDFPLMQSCDIQADEEGRRLDVVLDELRELAENATGENLDAEIEEQEELVEQIKNALQEKANNPGSGGVGISKIEKTSTEGLVDTYTITFTDESTSTFTVTNGKSAYEYAKSAGYTGTETSFAAQLAGTSMIGSWTFIDDPDLTTLPDESTEISFISNGTEYSAIKRSVVGPSNLSIYGMYYGDRAVYVNSPDENDGITHGWSDDTYKTITITKEPTDSYIAAWIKENAETVGAPSKRLKTKNKRIVDAINEINEKLDESDSSNDDLSNYQKNTDETLETESKEIVGAINEVNKKTADKIGYINTAIVQDVAIATDGIEIGSALYLTDPQGIDIASGTTNTRVPIVAGDNVTFTEDTEKNAIKINGSIGADKITNIDTWYDDMSNVSNDGDGISWTNRFYLSDSQGKLDAQGDITQKIPLVAGNNVTFSYDEENNAIAINATGGSSAADSMIGTWVLDENPTLEFGENEYLNLSFNFTCDGVSYECMWCDGYSLLYTIDKDTDSQEPVYDVDSGWYEGDKHRTISILEEPSTLASVWIRANATKQGGSNVGTSESTLPKIRFANFTSVKDEDNNVTAYRFTVENMGGGTLQVGDKLQICCKRKYPHGKQKLRKMAEYIITEDDLNYRFLKIEVDPTDESVQKWLFRNNRAGGGGGTLSAMYFRLKRVTAYNNDGEECNAIFSNVETVWKTYSTLYSDGNYALNIK